MNAVKWELEFGKPNEIRAEPEEGVVLAVELRSRKGGRLWTSALIVKGVAVHYNDTAKLSSEAKKKAENFYARWCEQQGRWVDA